VFCEPAVWPLCATCCPPPTACRQRSPASTPLTAAALSPPLASLSGPSPSYLCSCIFYEAARIARSPRRAGLGPQIRCSMSAACRFLPLPAAPADWGVGPHEADALTDRGSADPQLYIFGHLGRLKRAGAPGPASAGGRPTTSLQHLICCLNLSSWTNSARIMTRGAVGWVGGLAATAIPSPFGGCYLHRTLLLHLGLRARLTCPIMQVQLRLLLGQARLWQGNAP